MNHELQELLSTYISEFKKRVNSKIPFNAPICDGMYTEAVRLAYNDAKRAFNGITNTEEKCIEKANAMSLLANTIKNYFEDSIDFDHKVFCEKFRASFNEYHMTYGGAQKVVNLTFKYLYCFDEFRKKNYNKFANCQMVLDSFILGWFKRNVDLKSKVHIKYNETWSGMDDYNRYSNIEALIKEFVERKGDGLSVLEYEFILWPNTLIYESAISWMSTINEIDKSEVYNKYPFSELENLIKQIGSSCTEHRVSDTLKKVF